MQEKYIIVYDWMTSKLGHGVARDIYALLYAMCKANSGSCKCSHDYIIERVLCDKKQCKQALKRLADAGYIERVNNSAGGRGCLTEYTCKKGCDLTPLIGAKKGYNLTPLIDEKGGTKKPPLFDPPYKYILNNNNKVNEKENNIKESAAINRSTAPKPQPRFIKPTIEQVKAYIAAKGYIVDAEHFYNYYESQGWRVGRNPMKDWQAAVRTWQAKDKQQYGKHRTNSTIANAVEAAKLGIALADAQRAAGY